MGRKHNTHTQSKGSDLDSSCDAIKPKKDSSVVSYDISDPDNPRLTASKGSDGVVSDIKSDFDKCSSIMSDKETVHQYSKMTLRSRKKSIRDLTGGKTMVNRAAKKPRVPAVGMITGKIYPKEGLEKKPVFPVGPKVKFSTTFNLAELINSKHNERLKPESVRVKNVAVLSKLPRNKKPYVQDRLLG